MKTTIQIPIEKELKIKAEKMALELGYSSHQEFIRVFLKLSAEGKVRMGFYITDPRYKDFPLNKIRKN